MEQRHKEIDYIRAVSVLTVIMIHVTSLFIDSDSNIMFYNMNLAFILNQASRFAVPIFILISGIGLTFSARTAAYIGFVGGRFKKIAVPYLFWCVIYFLYNYNFDLQALYEKGLQIIPGFCYGVLTGGLSVHLYFIVIILQLYLLYPLLKILKRKFPTQTLLYSFMITFYFQLSIYLNSFGISSLPASIKGYAWIMAPTWLFYFVLGMYANERILAAVYDFGQKNIVALLVFVMMYALFFSIASKLTDTYDLSIKPQLLFYVGVVFVAIAGIARCLMRFKPVNKLVAFISAHSFTIYFVHVLILKRLVLLHYFEGRMLRMFLLYLILLILSVCAAVVIDFFRSFRRKSANSGC